MQYLVICALLSAYSLLPTATLILCSLALIPRDSVSSTDLSHHLPTTNARPGNLRWNPKNRNHKQQKKENKGKKKNFGHFISTLKCVKQKLWNAVKVAKSKRILVLHVPVAEWVLWTVQVQLFEYCILIWKQHEKLS